MRTDELAGRKFIKKRVTIHVEKGATMKTRAIVIIDYTIDGGFKAVAEEQAKLEADIAAMAKRNKCVVFHEVDMRERR